MPRVIAVLALIAIVLLGLWIWENLGGGEGVFRNVLRNTLLVVLIPWPFYFLGVLQTGRWRRSSPQEKADGNEVTTGNGERKSGD